MKHAAVEVPSCNIDVGAEIEVETDSTISLQVLHDHEYATSSPQHNKGTRLVLNVSSQPDTNACT